MIKNRFVSAGCKIAGKNQTAFEQQMLQDNRVVSASISRYVPGGVYDGRNRNLSEKMRMVTEQKFMETFIISIMIT